MSLTIEFEFVDILCFLSWRDFNHLPIQFDRTTSTIRPTSSEWLCT